MSDPVKREGLTGLYGRVLRFRSKTEHADAEKIRDALQGIALDLSRVVKFSEARRKTEIMNGAARIHSDVVRLLRGVQ